jgi:NtrC-family two-component system sensor histidine kinase KinB
MHLLETFANQIAAALQRGRLADEAQRVEHLKAMDRLKSEFVATASHELRTPLVALTAGIEALSRRLTGTLPAREAALLANAEQEGTRLRHLVDQLLDLSRLEAGATALTLEPASVRQLVADAVQPFLAAAEERRITLSWDVPDDVPEVRVDTARMHAVLENLIANAVRFTPVGGQVLVDAYRVGDFVQISVADSGAGIPLEDQARVFDRFTPVAARDGGGAGLGLAIAREAVLAHGGGIWVDSGPGPGSVFSFTIPVASAEAAVPIITRNEHAEDAAGPDRR